MALPVPADGQVDVWIARVGQLGESERLACEALLDDAERVRLANFALEHARTQFLTAYCLLRSVLSLYRPRHPSEWALLPTLMAVPVSPADKPRIFYTSICPTPMEWPRAR